MEGGYNKEMIRKQILRAREHSRKDLLEREKPQLFEQKLTFNILPRFSKCYSYYGRTKYFVNS